VVNAVIAVGRAGRVQINPSRPETRAKEGDRATLGRAPLGRVQEAGIRAARVAEAPVAVDPLTVENKQRSWAGNG